jgi:hypothetical protein
VTADTSIAISFDPLFAKSKVYIGKALKRKADTDLEEYQLWASLALELLGKAALANRHPCLIVDPTHTPSLFVAAGVAVTTDVKTIAARTLFERLKSVEPLFDEAVRTFCQSITDRRNSELHSGELPFKAMKAEAWEARYWHACQIILAGLGKSFKDWIGAEEAEEPQRIVQAKKDATFAAVMSKIEAARHAFFKLPRKEREQSLQTAEQSKGPPAFSHMFTFLSDHTWEQPCPACGAKAWLGGDKIHEEISEDAFGDSMWESVERTYSADEFECQVCSLELFGSDQLEAAGLLLNHTELEERQIEYEPEYGNC